MHMPRRLANSALAMAGLVFILALALRLIYLHGLQTNPTFAQPLMDAAYHDQWARRLAAGDWLGREVFFRAPLYPYCLGGLYAVFGPNPVAVRVVQFVLGALTCALTCLLGWRVAGRAVGLLAGLGAAAYGPLIYFDGELLLPVLETLFGTALVLALAGALESSMSQPPVPSAIPNGRPVPASRRPWVAAGLLLGLFAITRPNILAFLPVLVVYLVVRLGLRRAVAPGAALVVATALVIAPVTIRNAVVGHDRVLISSQGGLNLYIGNNPEADGTSAIVPGTRATWWGGYRDANAIAEREMGRPLKPSEVSAYWTRRTVEFITSEPGGWLRLMGRKAFLFWYGHELGNNAEEYAATWFSPLLAALMGMIGPLRYPFGLLGPLALVGMGLAAYGRERHLTPLILYVLAYSASIIAFFVCARYRIPLVPALLVLAAYGVVSGVKLAREHRLKPLAVAGVAVVALVVLLNTDLYHRGRIDYAKAYLDLGQAYLQAGRLDEAERDMRRAVAANGERLEPRLALANCLTQARRPAEARQWVEPIVAQQPDRWDALVILADALAAEGHDAAAVPHYERALELDPSGAEAVMRLARSLQRLGRTAEAERVLASGPTRVAGGELVPLTHARLALDRGDAEDAVRLAQEALKLAPELIAARRVLMLAYGRLGQLDQARPHAEAIVREHPDDVEALTVMAKLCLAGNRMAEAVPLLQRVTAADPARGEAWGDLAVALSFTGDLQGAIRAAEQALKLDPADSKARFTKAGCLLDLGRKQEAAAECRTLLEHDPDFAPAQKMLEFLQRKP